jgi:hypothetical protein
MHCTWFLPIEKWYQMYEATTHNVSTEKVRVV